MKKTILISSLAIVFMLVAGVSKAQDSKFLLGGGLAYATDINTAAAFVKGNYAITEKFEAAAQFTYFFPKNYGGADLKYHWMAFDVDGHYVFAKQEKMAFYGLVGFNIFMARYKSGNNSYSSSTSGLNLGGGGRFGLSDKLSALGEVKYVLNSGGYLQINAGILFAL